MLDRLPYMLLILAAGAVWPIQAVVNSKLKETTRQPLAAALVNGAGAAILAGFILLVVGLVLGKTAVPKSAQIAGTPWWAFGGGLFSVLVIVAQSASARPLGTALLVALFMAGQAIAALLVDRLGVLGIETRPVSSARLAGVTCLVAGAVLIAIDQRGSSGPHTKPSDSEESISLELGDEPCEG